MIRNKSFSGGPILYLIATPIGNLKEFTPRALEIVSSCDIVACEDTRVTKSLLGKFDIKKQLISLREHNELSATELVINYIKEGKSVVYMSDAGYPTISDPGKLLVKAARREGIAVSTVSGACAFINALSSSSLPSDRFMFVGFIDPSETKAKKQLEELRNYEFTLIFYESPHRIMKTLNLMYEVFGNRQATIARELTKLNEEYIEGPLEELTSIEPVTLRGEMVIVVEGNKEEKFQPSDDEVVNQVNNYINSGNSTKDAIKLAAVALNLPKNLVYDIVNKRKK